MAGSILILDLPPGSAGELSQALSAASPPDWDVVLASSLDELLRLAAAGSQPKVAVLLDGPRRRPGLAKWAEQLRRVAPQAALVVAAEKGDVQSAARAIQAGATDYLVCGPRLRDRVATLWLKLSRWVDVLQQNQQLDQQNNRLRESLLDRWALIGRSPQLQALRKQIARVAKIPRAVLIVGPRGSGKELVARAIHQAAGDPQRPIVTVNCAALSDSLLESELFGHERGAFTGAEAARPGKFDLADGGTLFLDEIGNMSLLFQQKILRVVEYGAFTRVGGQYERQVRVRIIAATNCDLKQRIAEGTFLPDLYDRLSFETLLVPPLRAREGDVELLAQHFLQEFARETPSAHGLKLSSAALAALAAYPFPGNVRELKNVIERAAYREEDGEISASDLQLPPLLSGPTDASAGGPFFEQLDDLARRLVQTALAHSRQNQAAAARALGLSYHQLRYYLRKFRLGKD